MPIPCTWPNGCKKTASHGKDGVMDRCWQHAKDGRVRMIRLCETEGCNEAWYSVDSGGRRRCREHGRGGKVIRGMMCEGRLENGNYCPKSAHMEYLGGVYCRDCAPGGEVKHGLCQGKNDDGSKCKVSAGYIHETGKFCITHAPTGSVLRYGQCKGKNLDGTACSKSGHFVENGILYCRDHSPTGRPRSGQCQGRKDDGAQCKSWALFIYSNGRFCGSHVPEDASILCEECSKICIEHGNEAGEALYCANCRPKLLDTYCSICQGCKKSRASRGNGTATHCAKCGPDLPNVRQRKCGCGKFAKFNVFGESADYCADCMETGMMARPTPRCIGCRSRLATYAKDKSSHPSYCEKDAPLGYIDMLNTPCAWCGIARLLRDGVCYFCLPGYKRTFARELVVKKSLEERGIVNIHNWEIGNDSIGRFRPDFHIVSNTHQIIVLEVDEEQHRYNCTYTHEHEVKRMIRIAHILNGYTEQSDLHRPLSRPTIFIRFNPDSYRRGNDLKRSEGESHEVRMDVVCQTIRNLLDCPNPTSYQVSAIYLYYDSFPNNTALIEINVANVAKMRGQKEIPSFQTPSITGTSPGALTLDIVPDSYASPSESSSVSPPPLLAHHSLAPLPLPSPHTFPPFRQSSMAPLTSQFGSLSLSSSPIHHSSSPAHFLSLHPPSSTHSPLPFSQSRSSILSLSTLPFPQPSPLPLPHVLSSPTHLLSPFQSTLSPLSSIPPSLPPPPEKEFFYLPLGPPSGR